MKAIRLRAFLFLVLLCIFQTSIAQKFNPYYNFKHLNVQNGLVQNIVYHFLQDSRGYMWIRHAEWHHAL